MFWLVVAMVAQSACSASVLLKMLMLWMGNLMATLDSSVMELES